VIKSNLNMKAKFVFFIGTSAELIKLIPVISEFENAKIKYLIYASGQTNLKQSTKNLREQ